MRRSDDKYLDNKMYYRCGPRTHFQFQNKKTMEANTHFIVTAFYISTAHNVSQC